MEPRLQLTLTAACMHGPGCNRLHMRGYNSRLQHRAHTHAPCPCPMSMSTIHVHVHHSCPCPPSMSMPMPMSMPMSMSMSMSHVHECIPWCIHGASLVHPRVHAICICVCHGTFWDILHSTPDVREVQSPPLPPGGVACGGVGGGAGPLRRVRSVCSGELPSSPERPSPSSEQSEWAAVMRSCGRSCGRW